MKQSKINEMVVHAYENCIAEYDALRQRGNMPRMERLYRCNAVMIECGEYVLLRSYNTIVAAYDVSTDAMYDFLRYVYGYTATSAQHIAKFRNRFQPLEFFRYRRD